MTPFFLTGKRAKATSGDGKKISIKRYSAVKRTKRFFLLTRDDKEKKPDKDQQKKKLSLYFWTHQK